MNVRAILSIVPALLLLGTAAPASPWPLGDTLTVIMRPILGVPSILAAGETLDVWAKAPPGTDAWNLALLHAPCTVPLGVAESVYDGSFGLWRLRMPIPAGTPEELYDLFLSAPGVAPDTARHAVKVLERYEEEWYFAQVTDTHVPGHTYSQIPGWERDSTELQDFLEVVRDINVIAPEFLLLTGDFINEGELEEYHGYRAYSRAKRALLELDVPVFLVSGNHDIGGWNSTPPPDGTARRNWWRFFGWPWLADPPDGVYTQNYAFDYGPVRFIGLEAYLNYDGWLSEIYGGTSLREKQLEFLREKAGGSPAGSKKVLFFHYDFGNQITDPASYGIDMILYGHDHRDEGSIDDPIPVLGTESCADGNRAYRIVRVRGGNRIAARETVRAGRNGENLSVILDRPNDGTSRENGATLVNSLDQPLEFCEIRFVMDREGESYTAKGGEVIRLFDADTALVVTVRAPAAAGESVRVELAPGSSRPSPEAAPQGLVLYGNKPNPMNGVTEIRFDVPEPGRVEIRLFDARGRYLFPIARGPFSDGSHAVPWDGTAPSGVRLPTGVYFYSVLYEGETRTGRLVYLR